MKTPTLLILVSVLFFAGGCNTSNSPDYTEAPFPCEDGLADGKYPCSNIDLFAHVTIDELTLGNAAGVTLNDIWGWTDPQTQKEYALVGLSNGISFVDISVPENPIVVGVLPESSLSHKFKALPLAEYPACNLGLGASSVAKSITQGSAWRDHKVFNNHLYIVSDAQPHGMQVFDLTKLRAFSDSALVFSHDFLYDKIGSAHNIAINEETGFAYLVGSTQAELCGGRDSTGLHMVDLNDPKNPVFAGCYMDTSPGFYRVAPGYIHDTQCVIYNGPDREHAGKEICFNSAEGNVVIADVSDKSNPVTIGYQRHAQMQYSHQGWLTDDHAWFLMNDELDERNLGRNTKTYIWDVRNLENPEFVGYYEHTTNSIDHNLYIKQNFAFLANYTSGLRVLDITKVASAEIKLVAFFDTQPLSDIANFSGLWSNYPYFDSGMVIVSDIEDGLFVLRPRLH